MRHVAIQIGCVEVRVAVAAVGARGIEPGEGIHRSTGGAERPAGADAIPKGQRGVGNITYIKQGLGWFRLNDGAKLPWGGA